MITKIWCGRAGQIAYEFSNGNVVSFVWAWGTYSDNHMQRIGYEPGRDIHKQDWESTTVEVYSMGEDTNGFTKWLERKYKYGNPAGYVPVNDIPAILRRADREPVRK